MDVAVIVVGMDQWEQFTLPAIQSVRLYEPDVRLIVMDCGKTPYPLDHGVNASVVRLADSPSYAYAINEGIRISGPADWYLILNNDILFEGPVTPYIKAMIPDAIYGRQIIQERVHRWLGLWLALIPYDVWNRVGQFDEDFKVCGFEDADYCVRAKSLGIETRWTGDLPIVHFWGQTRWGIPGYETVRRENMIYFEQKHGFRLGDTMTVIHE